MNKIAIVQEMVIPDIFDALPEWLLVIIGVLSLLFAFYQIRQNRKNIRQKETLGFMRNYNQSVKIEEGFRVIRKYEKKPLGNEDLLATDDDEQRSDRANFLFLANEMECLAIGLKHKIYDQDMVHDFFGTDLTQIYDRAKAGGLIDAIRRETDDKSFLLAYEGSVEELKRWRKKRT